MNSNDTYDAVVIGGGVAGLSAAILLSRRQYKVLVLEKESYPKHKVCGEYISLESKQFLESLGLPIADMHLPIMNKLLVTDTRGNEVNTTLPQGGFGLSRYKLDAALASLAQKAGATLLTKSRVDNVQYEKDALTVTAGGHAYSAKAVCGAWGKRSNMDVKWQRSFIKKKNNALNNYVGVKYHIRYPWLKDYIGLHNYTDGYCGISHIEEDKCCICYLTTAAMLQKSGNDLKKLERDVLMKNPWLHRIFSEAAFLFEHPVVISQVSFDKKEQVEDHVLLMGDAAGMIPSLCGNGMSMAFHAAKMASEIMDDFLQGRISRAAMEKSYAAAWKNKFSTRTALGRIVQSNFGKDLPTALFLKTMKAVPFLRNALIKGTSGKPF